MIIISEFAKIESRRLACALKEQLSNISTEYKPFKAEYQDLLSMPRGAYNRLKTAIAGARKKNAQKATAPAASAETKRRVGRPPMIWQSCG